MWKGTIKFSCKEMGFVNLGQDRVQWPTFLNMVMHTDFLKGGEFLD